MILNTIITRRILPGTCSTFFELGGCHGTPEKLSDNDVINLVNKPIIPQFERSELRYSKAVENVSYPNDALAFHQGSLFINHQQILQKLREV